MECARGEEIGAYLDGELSPAAQHVFESHLSECPTCAAELRNQQGLLRTLDLALNAGPALELPDNFSRLVAVRAESDLGGVRSCRGNGRALRFTAALSLGALFLLAAGRSDVGPAGLKNLAFGLLGLLDIFSRLLFDLVLGLVIVLRAVGRWLIQTPSPVGSLSVIFFAGTLFMLVRQVRRFHRR
jgi:predicted anti-sigma-YlaC factor YlaD